MKSIRIAIYSLIALHFLRKTTRKLSPGSPRKPHGNTHGKYRGHPVQVGVGITRTNRPKGAPHYDYVRVATCIDLDTASALAKALNTMGYGHTFFLIDPDEEINGYALEVLKSDKIHLLRDNFRNCPNPDRLAKIMQEAAIFVILHGIFPHG